MRYKTKDKRPTEVVKGYVQVKFPTLPAQKHFVFGSFPPRVLAHCCLVRKSKMAPGLNVESVNRDEEHKCNYC